MTADYFAVLGLPPVDGRLPAAEDFASGSAPVVFISHGCRAGSSGQTARALAASSW